MHYLFTLSSTSIMRKIWCQIKVRSNRSGWKKLISRSEGVSEGVREGVVRLMEYNGVEGTSGRR